MATKRCGDVFWFVDTHFAPKLFEDAVVGDGLADERLRFRHLASILGCGTEASQRIRVTAMVQHCVLRFEMWPSLISSGLAQLLMRLMEAIAVRSAIHP